MLKIKPFLGFKRAEVINLFFGIFRKFGLRDGVTQKSFGLGGERAWIFYSPLISEAQLFFKPNKNHNIAQNLTLFVQKNFFLNPNLTFFSILVHEWEKIVRRGDAWIEIEIETDEEFNP